MAFLESGKLCTLQEYLEFFDKRVFESEVQEGDIYMYMMQLDNEAGLAAQQPVRINGVARRVGAMTLELSCLDEDLQPYCSKTERIKNGVISRVLGDFFCFEDEEAHGITEAYLLGYDPEAFELELAASAELSLVGSAS